MNSPQLVADIKQLGTRFIIVTGGVCSSLGKGVLTSAIGVLMKNSGSSVSVVKCDPYLNVDPGTMSPLVHGEVFVTDDGAETDLDLGHYERMIGVTLNKTNSVSAGQVFQEILDGERRGEFLGKCIQLVPHVVDAINARLYKVAAQSKSDFVLVEIGGTVGDIEGEIFLEAIRQMRLALGSDRMFHCHLSYVPYLSWAQEIKTKPTQHSIMLLKRAGLVPDGLFLRTDCEITEKIRRKLHTMTGVPYEHIFEVRTRDPLYELFIDLDNQGLSQIIYQSLGLKLTSEPDLTAWARLIEVIKKEKPTVKIGLVAKYVGSSEPYISVYEAIKAACWAYEVDPDIIMIDASHLEKELKGTPEYEKAWKMLKSVDGVVMPGGFDKRGVEGKIAAVTWARETRVPYLGLCLGMQVMIIEAARTLAGLEDATSTEFGVETANPVFSLLEEQKGISAKGASMRLGASSCQIVPNTCAYKAYGVDEVKERHRHRYEFNNAYKKVLQDKGVVFSGLCAGRDLVEIAELDGHPFMLGVQFHPEFLSRPYEPHPLFRAFIGAIVKEEG